ncbi:MAG: hypothetical protein AAB325_18520, partial [Pseudomonadota bacterium]
FIWGDLSEVEYREQSRQLKTQLAQIPTPALLLDLRKALSYMKDFKSLVEKSSPELQRKFVSEVLRQVKIKDKVVVAIEPKPAYLPLFVLDRAKKLSGVVGPDGFEPSTNRL